MSSPSSPTPKNEFFAGVLRYNLPSRIGEWAKSKVVMHFKRVNYWTDKAHQLSFQCLNAHLPHPFWTIDFVIHRLKSKHKVVYVWKQFKKIFMKFFKNDHFWHDKPEIWNFIRNIFTSFLLKIISHLNTFRKHKQVPYKFGLAQNERKINAIMRVCHVE